MKTQLRKKYLYLRKNYSGPELASKSQLLCQVLSNWLKKQSYRNIFSYYAFRGEPSLKLLFEELSKTHNFFLPKISENRKMDFYSWQKDQDLVPNRFGILEPSKKSKNKMKPDKNSIVLLPVAAVDLFGNRLGYGGGYYDKFLAEYSDLKKIAVSFEFSILRERIPSEPHDQRVSFIASEKKIYDLSHYEPRKKESCFSFVPM